MFNSIRAWLGLEGAAGPEPAPLRELVDALDRLEPGRARHLARFAYLLGRVADADRVVTKEETAKMESLLQAQGGLSADQAMLVVALARTSNQLFGGTADFQVAHEFAETTSYEEKLALARCLFAVAAADAHISPAEETEVHRITNQLHIRPQDLLQIRMMYRRFLPGLSAPDPPET